MTLGVVSRVALTPYLSTCTEQQLQEEIAVNLPPKWSFSLGSNEEETRWEVPVFNEGGEEVWKGTGVTSQLALLETIGWLAIRNHPVSSGSPWVRRRGELNPDRVHETLFSKTFDPKEVPDLDPQEVSLVYSGVRKT
jgi:hypothetical protein